MCLHFFMLFYIYIGGRNMNRMRTPEEKEKILKDYLNGMGISSIVKKYQVRDFLVYRWLRKYQEKGLEGLKSNTGRNSSLSKNKGLYLRKPKSKIEELEIELMKKDIEIARLKKGYNVKGVGQEKEFVTTFNKNTK